MLEAHRTPAPSREHYADHDANCLWFNHCNVNTDLAKIGRKRVAAQNVSWCAAKTKHLYARIERHGFKALFLRTSRKLGTNYGTPLPRQWFKDGRIGRRRCNSCAMDLKQAEVLVDAAAVLLYEIAKANVNQARFQMQANTGSSIS